MIDQLKYAGQILKRFQLTTVDDFGVGFSLLTENCLNLGARHAVRGSDITKERFDALDRDSAILVLVGNGEHVLLASGWQFVDVTVCRLFVEGIERNGESFARKDIDDTYKYMQ